jgi:hypothetical protein
MAFIVTAGEPVIVRVVAAFFTSASSLVPTSQAFYGGPAQMKSMSTLLSAA